ncbi:MAG: hypothetical protein C3F07_12850 [Anaerolineales bacterium]|nr:MAG: hypothetical protein C3F07_12850 [Anaerolineales bacterium]
MSRTRLFFRRWQNWLGFLLILFYAFVAIAAPYLSPNDPKNPGPFMRVGRAFESRPLPPDDKAVLGLLPRGIDVYHALVWGSRDAMRFGLIVAMSTALFGIVYGAVSGYAEGIVGNTMLRIADAFLAFPPIAGVVFLQQLYMTTVSALGGFVYPGVIFFYTDEPVNRPLIQALLESVDPLMLSLIAFSWMPFARLVHSIVITLKQTDFIQAARALGGSPLWIIRKHILRNSTGPAVVLAARDVGGVVLLQATLTFIGIGGGSVWGQMLADGRNWILGPGGSLLTYWWVFLPPTLAVTIFGVAWNVFGDSLNDVLVPTAHVDAFPGRSLRKMKKQKKAEPLPAPGSDTSGIIPTGPAGSTSIVGDRGSKQTPVGDSRSNGFDPVLRAAREDLARGDLPRALHAYNHLVQRGRLIDEILPDLAQLVKKHPRDPRVWQTLGDALTQAGDSVHAAQSYEQARKYGN